MPRNRTLAALIGLYAGLAACEDTSTEPELSPADAASPRAGALRWSATRLGITGGLATDVNNQGQVVGYRGTNQGTRAFLWSNGTFQHLGTLGGGDSRAFAINEAGQVIGRSTTATGATHAFLWQNGTMRDLGTLDAEFSDATGIDGSGRVVGSTENFSGMGTRAFLWENGQMRRLAGLDTVPSAATGIDNQGRIVGWYGDRQSPRAFLWTAGRVTDLGTLGGPWSAANATVGGKIVGSSAKASVQRAFFWQNGTMTGLGAISGGSSGASAINALGVIVGWSQQPDSQPRAVIWRDGVMSAIAVGVAEDVNKAGWVVGSGSISFPVLWKETTDPPPPAGSITVGTSYFLSDRSWTTDAAVDTVAVGTRVTWTWVTGPAVPHTVQSIGTPSFTSSGNLGGVGVTYSVTFSRAVTYLYNCARHPGNMFGRVVVR